MAEPVDSLMIQRRDRVRQGVRNEARKKAIPGRSLRLLT